MSEWRSLLLGDVLQFQRGFDLPTSQRVDGVVPIVSSSGITGYHNEAKIQSPAVVIGRTGTLGSVFLLQEPCWPLNTSLWVKDFKGNDPRFVAALLESIDVTPANDKTSVPGVNRNDLHRFETRVPDLGTQKAIGAVIAALDSRTALCREQAATLESIAAAIFRSRFVDFDGLSAFVESEQGRIPAGWRVLSLRDVCEVVKGLSYKSSQLVEASETALVTLKNFGRSGGFQARGFKPFDGPYKASQVVLPGDVLVAHTDLTQAAEVIGRPIRIPAQDQFSTLVASLDTAVVRPLDEHVTREYLLGVFETSRWRHHALARTNGTTVLHLSSKALEEYPLLIPPPDVLEEFGEFMTPIHARLDALSALVADLEAIRSALLPRLVSGEIAVPESLIEAYGTGEPVAAV